MSKEDERILKGLQQPKLKADELLQQWYVPRVLELVNKALEHGERKESLLVVGCGKGDDAFMYSDYLELDSNVVGIDINNKSIRIANEIKAGYPREPKFLVGNILDKNIGKKIFRETKLGPFDATVFNGVFEYLLTTDEIERALSNTEQLLKPDGKLIISDFVWWKPKDSGENWWEKRYRRDEEALRLLGIKGDIYGIIIVRPMGLHSDEVMSLTAKEVAKALREGNFERFVRHWRFTRIKEFLKEAGFEVLDERRKLMPGKVFWDPRENYGEKDLLFNYEILAKRN